MNMDPWHAQDSFWESVGFFLFSEQRRADAPAEVENVITLAGLKPGARILDLPCGVGRHSLEFARRGFQVTAVDRTGAYLEQASRQALLAGLPVEYIQEDMRSFARPESFDAALNLYTSFGYFADPAEDRQVLLNFYQSLRPGGVLVMELMGKEVLARIFRERDWREEGETIILEERQVSANWGWIDNHWILIRAGDRHYLSAIGDDLTHRSFQRRSGSPGHHNSRPPPGKLQRRSAANTAVSAHDDHRLLLNRF